MRIFVSKVYFVGEFVVVVVVVDVVVVVVVVAPKPRRACQS